MNHYDLSDVLKHDAVKGLDEGARRRVERKYLDTLALVEERAPYSFEKYPGLNGVIAYTLDKNIVAYSAAVREAQKAPR